MAGAAGAALLVGIMAFRQASLEAVGVPADQALVGGLHTAFLVAAGISCAAVVLAFMMRKTDSTVSEGAPL